MELILIRHGTTQGNKERRFIGVLDVPLAPEGEELARRVAPTLPAVDHVYRSPLLRCEQTAVGDKYVSENMTANSYSLGGEQSGHIIFSKHATTGDGILTSLKIMEVLLEKKTTLGTLASEVTIYPQLLENLRVTDKKAVLEHPAVVEAIHKVEEALGTDGRILVRESGTEPLLRVMVEATTQELCKEYVSEVINVMKSVM